MDRLDLVWFFNDDFPLFGYVWGFVGGGVDFFRRENVGAFFYFRVHTTK